MHEADNMHPAYLCEGHLMQILFILSYYDHIAICFHEIASSMLLTKVYLSRAIGLQLWYVKHVHDLNS